MLVTLTLLDVWKSKGGICNPFPHTQVVPVEGNQIVVKKLMHVMYIKMGEIDVYICTLNSLAVYLRLWISLNSVESLGFDPVYAAIRQTSV